MNLSGSKKATGKLKGTTPATIAIAVLYLGLVVYFMVESYFLSPEQYAGSPPYLLIATLGLVTVFATFFALGKIEPARSDTLSYALLIGMGFMFFLYPFMTRVNVWLDDGSLEAHVYVLNSEYTWVAKDAETPNIDMYIESSVWWQQYQPGDEYTFNLRHGGLGFWQINMTQIYDDQVQWGFDQLIGGQGDSEIVVWVDYY